MQPDQIPDLDRPERDLVHAGLSQVIVARVYGVSVNALREPGRGTARVSGARHVAIYLARIVFAMSFAALARGFGRDRATAAYAVQRVEAMRDDPETDRTLGWLETMLRTAMETQS